MAPSGARIISSSGLRPEECKRLNAYLGVSLSKATYFSKRRMAEYIRWSTLHFDKLLIIVADHLEAYDYQVFKRVPFEIALQKTHRIGQDLVKGYLRAVPQDLESNVQVVTATELLARADCSDILQLVKNATVHTGFKQDLIDTVLKALSGKILAVISPDYTMADILTILVNYLVEEIAIILYLSNKTESPFKVALFPYPPQKIITDIFAGQHSLLFPSAVDGKPFQYMEVEIDI
jgi:tRNA-dependent cyclodipeptide synthase